VPATETSEGGFIVRLDGFDACDFCELVRIAFISGEMEIDAHEAAGATPITAADGGDDVREGFHVYFGLHVDGDCGA
jgi:hypothetical protein